MTGKYTNYELAILSEYNKKLMSGTGTALKVLNTKNVSEHEAHRRALLILKYVFEDIFHWSPSDAEQYFSQDVIDRMQLQAVIKSINFPPEMNKKTDFYYFSWMVYPQNDITSLKERTLHTFNRCIIDESGKHLPKGFFSGKEGMIRAIICFSSLLSAKFSFASVRDYYEYMSTSKGSSLLTQYRLMEPCRVFFGDPINFLHETLDETKRDETLKEYYTFVYQERLKIKKDVITNAFRVRQ